MRLPLPRLLLCPVITCDHSISLGTKPELSYLTRSRRPRSGNQRWQPGVRFKLANDKVTQLARLLPPPRGD